MKRHIVKHGTMNEYNNFGCRCDRCRTAMTDYLMTREPCPSCGGRKSRYRKLCKNCAPSLQPSHGISRYRKGCRCDVCRAASAESKRKQRSRHREYYNAYDRERRRKVA